MLFHVKPHQWWTRYWQLGRKIEKQGGKPTVHDVRVAAILLQHATSLCNAGLSDPSIRTAADNIEWVIEHGNKARKAHIAFHEAQARLGS